MPVTLITNCTRENVVGTATRYGLDESWFEPRWTQDTYLQPTALKPTVSSTTGIGILSRSITSGECC